MYNLKKYGKNITNTYFEEVQMETSNLKNMVVLKNLPSNIVDEAIIVLKANKKTKKLQKIENKKILENQENKKDKEYILKEAEMIVNNYISKIENKENDKIIISKDTDGKYKKLKKYAIATTLLCIIQAIVIIF